MEPILNKIAMLKKLSHNVVKGMNGILKNETFMISLLMVFLKGRLKYKFIIYT